MTSVLPFILLSPLNRDLILLDHGPFQLRTVSRDNLFDNGDIPHFFPFLYSNMAPGLSWCIPATFLTPTTFLGKWRSRPFLILSLLLHAYCSKRSLTILTGLGSFSGTFLGGSHETCTDRPLRILEVNCCSSVPLLPLKLYGNRKSAKAP
jgi:hypothetical protein